MKRIVLLIVLVLLIGWSVDAQILDRAPSGQQNYRAVEGGSEPVKIDTVTPLPELIKKFEKPWQFVETGKMYWIGYTDDMYSIAVHGDRAIKPLISFIETTDNEDAKIGAVYTLHLIGINREIVGRFIERFTNKNAREALLYLLKYHDLDDTIMDLLIRDPWLSDVPKLFSMLKEENISPGYLVSGLLHYRLEEIKINQDIPDDVGNITVGFPSSYPDMKAFDFGVEAESQAILHAIAALRDPRIEVDTTLFGTRIWVNMYYPIEGKLVDLKRQISVNEFLNEIVTPNNTHLVVMTNYGFLGNKIYFYAAEKKMIICSALIAKPILLKWWADQPDAYKQQFNQDQAKSFR